MLSNPLVNPLGPPMRGLRKYGKQYPSGLVHLWNAINPTSRRVGPYPVFSAASQQPDANGNLVPWPVNIPGRGVEVHGAYTQLAQNSKLLNAVAGSPGTGPDNWTYTVVAAPTMAVIARAVGNSITFSGTASRGYLSVSQAMTALSVYTFSFKAICDGVLQIDEMQYCSLTGGTIVVSMDGVVVADENAVPTAGVHVFSIKVTAGAVGDTATFRFGLGASAVATGSVTVYEPQLVLGAYVLPYAASGIGVTVAVASTASTSADNGLAIPLDAKMRECFERSVTDGVEKVPGSSSVLMRKADWGIIGEDATHIVSDVAGGLRYQSGTTSPQLILSVGSAAVVGATYKVVIAGVNVTSGLLKMDMFGGVSLVNGTFILTATATSLSFTRAIANVDITIGSISIQRLAPSVFTAAALCWMGVGSGELPAGATTYANLLSCRNAEVGALVTYKTVEGNIYYGRSNDGTNNALNGISSVWNRGEIHLKVTQTNALGTQFRVGNRRYTSAMVPIDALTWSGWVAYDGSMNPLTHLRFGYTSTVPIGFLQTQLWKISATPEQIDGLLRYAL